MGLFSHASAILSVPNVQEAAEYYRDVLGFRISFLWQDPPTYGVVNRDDTVGLHFTEEESIAVPKEAKLYIFVNDVDAVYQEYLASGATIVEQLNDTAYKMREFVIEDINGYRLVIGQGID